MNKNCFVIGKDQLIKLYGIIFFNKNMFFKKILMKEGDFFKYFNIEYLYDQE